ncbi:MAG: PaaI family thioesterase [Acidimicrobiia bacterium]|nr:PaaI family thioesterase [Acidimicrobiia bacterium]
MPRQSLLTHRVIPVPPGAALPPYHVPWCFGCGPENEHGLRLEAHLDGDRVVADLRLAPWFAGGPGVAHGGAVAAFFDDLMGFVPVAHFAPAVTARFEIDFIRPVFLGAPLRAEAWLSEREGRKLFAEGIGRDPLGEVYVEARALYLEVGFEHFTGAVAEMPAEQVERLSRFLSDEFYP